MFENNELKDEFYNIWNYEMGYECYYVWINEWI